MNEKYVISLDLAKKLKELKCPQESEFWWIDRQDALGFEICDKYSFAYYTTSALRYSAFLSDELLEMLPWSLRLEIETSGLYGVRYPYAPDKIQYFTEKKPCDALAKMVEYCVVNNLIKGEGGK